MKNLRFWVRFGIGSEPVSLSYDELIKTNFKDDDEISPEDGKNIWYTYRAFKDDYLKKLKESNEKIAGATSPAQDTDNTKVNTTTGTEKPFIDEPGTKTEDTDLNIEEESAEEIIEESINADDDKTKVIENNQKWFFGDDNRYNKATIENEPLSGNDTKNHGEQPDPTDYPHRPEFESTKYWQSEVLSHEQPPVEEEQKKGIKPIHLLMALTGFVLGLTLLILRPWDQKELSGGTNTENSVPGGGEFPQEVSTENPYSVKIASITKNADETTVSIKVVPNRDNIPAWISEKTYLQDGEKIFFPIRIEGTSRDSTRRTILSKKDSIEIRLIYPYNLGDSKTINLIEFEKPGSKPFNNPLNFFNVDVDNPAVTNCLCTNSSEYQTQFMTDWRKNKGKVFFWTNAAEGGEVNIFIDKILKGKLTSYSTTRETIGGANTTTFELPVNKYRYLIEVPDKNRIWEGEFTLTSNSIAEVFIEKNGKAWKGKKETFDELDIVTWDELTIDDLDGKSDADLQLIINQAYARKGLIFKAKALQDFFKSKPWYLGRTTSQEEINAQLNDTEKKNIRRIQAYMKR